MQNNSELEIISFDEVCAYFSNEGLFDKVRKTLEKDYMINYRIIDCGDEHE